MARLARVVVPGIPYHLTHQGNHRANVFFNDDYRLAWLDELAGAPPAATGWTSGAIA